MVKNIIILLFVVLTQSLWVPKIVWTYWEDPLSQQNHQVRIFFENHKNFLNNNGWQYRFLNKNNVKSWIQNKKQIVQALQSPQFQKELPNRRANLIRLAVIRQYGGIWIDYSTFFVHNLDWLENLKQNYLIQNINGDQPDVLMTYDSYVTPPTRTYDAQTKKYFLTDLRFQTSFIAAKPKASLINEWLKYYMQGKRITRQKIQRNEKMRLDNYIVDTVYKQKIEPGTFGSPYFQFELSLITVLQRKQRELDKIWLLNQKKGFRKFAVKQYNIWTMAFQKTTYLSSSISGPYQQDSFITYLFIRDQEYLKQNKIDTIYPVKITGPGRKYIKEYLNRPNSLKQNCSQLAFINQASLFYKYLIKDYPVKFIKNIGMNKYYSKLNLGYFCPKIVSWRQIILDYTQNGLGNEINKIFQNTYSQYYIQIEQDASTLGLYTRNWSGISINTNFQQNKNQISFFRQAVKYLNTTIGQTNIQNSFQLKFTLKQLCQAHYEKKPTFLKIGKKGVELMVLHTNDWDNLKCRPEVIQIMDIKNQVNYLQHKALLMRQDYVLLNNYKLNQNQTISQTFVTKQKFEYYYKRYKYAEARGQNRVGVINFKEVKKIVEKYIQTLNIQNNKTLSDRVFYYFNRASYPLIISNIIKNKRFDQKPMPIFVFGFEPLNSEVIINSQYNKSIVYAQYLKFLKIDVRINIEIMSIFIFDSNNPNMNDINIKNFFQKDKEQLRQVKNISNNFTYLTYSNLLRNFIKQYIKQYSQINKKVFILYKIILLISIISIICLAIAMKAVKKMEKYQNQQNQRNQFQTQL